MANGYFVGAINRPGFEEPWRIGEFYGQSYFCDPRGQMLAVGRRDGDDIVIADLDLDLIREVRNTWQFFRDRRPETYGADHRALRVYFELIIKKLRLPHAESIITALPTSLRAGLFAMPNRTGSSMNLNLALRTGLVCFMLLATSAATVRCTCGWSLILRLQPAQVFRPPEASVSQATNRVPAHSTCTQSTTCLAASVLAATVSTLLELSLH